MLCAALHSYSPVCSLLFCVALEGQAFACICVRTNELKICSLSTIPPDVEKRVRRILEPVNCRGLAFRMFWLGVHVPGCGH